jgi:4-diphosphocytidyl-2-C-methyl-D-erythritol kinase
MIVKAPAKLNLHLEIGCRRADGYHELRSLFAMIDLFDVIDADVKEQQQFSCTLSGDTVCAPKHNTMYRAAKLFSDASGISFSCDMRCEKHIPAEAGLGGGSSDAAALLKALNSHFNSPLDGGKMRELAIAVGSDVPFFLEGPVSYVEGRGEQVTPVQHGNRTLQGILILPHFSSSTAGSYGELDESRVHEPAFAWVLDKEAIVNAYSSLPASWPYFNSFSTQLYLRYPEYFNIEQSLRAAGCDFIGISGSGSSMFGFSNEGVPDIGVLSELCLEQGWELYAVTILQESWEDPYLKH